MLTSSEMNVHKHERLMINVHGFSLLSPCISNGLEQVSQQLTRNPFIRSEESGNKKHTKLAHLYHKHSQVKTYCTRLIGLAR